MINDKKLMFIVTAKEKSLYKKTDRKLLNYRQLSSQKQRSQRHHRMQKPVSW